MPESRRHRKEWMPGLAKADEAVIRQGIYRLACSSVKTSLFLFP
ncbi:hypothetical protein [Paenibacillus sp. HW567]|nr:hypothetical protein [Paenibacillus sp. HW567]